MSLYVKVLLAVLIPLGAFAVFGSFQLQDVINHYESALLETYKLKTAGVQNNLERETSQLTTAATVLSESVEISRALQKADNEVLYDFSHRFIGPVDMITFADANGIVISRAPDEYRFGDDISATHHFRETWKNGRFHGISELEMQPSIVVSRIIKKYDDVPIGAVFVSKALTRNMLNSLTEGNRVVLEVNSGDFSLTSSDLPVDDIHSETLTGFLGENTPVDTVLRVHFLEDENFKGLLQLKDSIYTSGIFVYGLFIVLLLLILWRQLKPISVIIGHVLDYAGQRLDTASLKEKLTRVQNQSNTAGQKIASAIVQLLDTINKNIAEKEKANEALKKTVEELERSLAEIKTLKGLLPICASCKKIRDDSGYWENLEYFIEAHSEAYFSHGVCPECAEKLYGKYPWYGKYKDRQT